MAQQSEGATGYFTSTRTLALNRTTQFCQSPATPELCDALLPLSKARSPRLPTGSESIYAPLLWAERDSPLQMSCYNSGVAQMNPNVFIHTLHKQAGPSLC